MQWLLTQTITRELKIREESNVIVLKNEYVWMCVCMDMWERIDEIMKGLAKREYKQQIYNAQRMRDDDEGEKIRENRMWGGKVKHEWYNFLQLLGDIMNVS